MALSQKQLLSQPVAREGRAVYREAGGFQLFAGIGKYSGYRIFLA